MKSIKIDIREIENLKLVFFQLSPSHFLLYIMSWLLLLKIITRVLKVTIKLFIVHLNLISYVLKVLLVKW